LGRQLGSLIPNKQGDGNVSQTEGLLERVERPVRGYHRPRWIGGWRHLVRNPTDHLRLWKRVSVGGARRGLQCRHARQGQRRRRRERSQRYCLQRQ